MPALILFKRRWKLASDDLVIPAAVLAAFHFAWTVALAYMLVASWHSPREPVYWIGSLRGFVVGLAAIFPTGAFLEVAIATVSSRGGPLKTSARSGVSVLLYLRIGILAVELFWEILSLVWLFLSGEERPGPAVLGIIFGFLFFNWLATFFVIAQFGKAPPMRDNLGCSFRCSDEGGTAGAGSGVYSSIGEVLNRNSIMSGSLAICDDDEGRTKERFYGSHEVCCLLVPSKRHSFSQLEKVISFALGDLDLVRSDVVAGLILLRRSQRSIQDTTIAEPSNEVYQFLSGTPITTTTRFLGFKSQSSVEFYSRVVRFMRYPLAAHRLAKGATWKKFEMSRKKWGTDIEEKKDELSKRMTSDGVVRTLQSEPIEKELANLIGRKQFELLHCSLLNSDLDGLSFFVGLDHEFRAVIICLWSAICLKEALSKMCSISVTSQRTVVRPEWSASEYFAKLAERIHSKLSTDDVLLGALRHDQSSSLDCYEVIVTGQSVAGGVACVLAVLLKQSYHNLHCFAYAPPNSILSATCVRETQSFITTVVVGKDVVPRLSCTQIETFRQNLVSNLKSCSSPKLKILCSQRLSPCCPDRGQPSADRHVEYLGREGDLFDKSTGLHLPGRVVHIVRSRPKTSCSHRMSQCKRHSVFQAVWARNEDFRTVLVSRKMVSDHCPFLIMDALEKVLTHISPAKPVRKGAGGRHHSRGHLRPAISANSSHNETTLTSQNTVSDFSASEQLIESAYAPATLSAAPPLSGVRPNPLGFSSHSNIPGGNFDESGFGTDSGQYERISNQTFPKVKLRSGQPSELSSRVIRDATHQMMSSASNGISAPDHTQTPSENLYNTISTPNHLQAIPSISNAPAASCSGSEDRGRNAAGRLLFSGEQSAKRQPILIDNWTGAFAPLASPEALSESSSLASCGEAAASSSATGHPFGLSSGLPGQRGDSIKRLSSGAAYQRLVARIDPIRQSPLGPVHPFSGGEGDMRGSKDLPERIKSARKSSLASKSTTCSATSRSTNQERGSVNEGQAAAGDLVGFGEYLSHDPDSKESYYAEIGEPPIDKFIGANSERDARLSEIGPSDWPGPQQSQQATGLKSDSLYDLIFDSSPTESKVIPKENDQVDSDLMVFSPPSSVEHSRAKPSPFEPPCEETEVPMVLRTGQKAAQESQASAVSTFRHEPIYSKVIPRQERKSENSETPSGGYASPATEPSPGPERRSSGEGRDAQAILDPSSTGRSNDNDDDDDDYEEAQEQFMYDLVVGHYSCAGRGYPHGFIQSYSRTAFDMAAQFSVAEEVVNPPTDIF